MFHSILYILYQNYHQSFQWYRKNIDETDYSKLGDIQELQYNATADRFEGGSIAADGASGTQYYFDVTAEYNQLTATKQSAILTID